MMTKHYFIAAGGTGGHMIPALCLYEELFSRNDTASMLTDHRGAKYCAGTNHIVLPVDGFGRAGFFRKLWGGFTLIISIYLAYKHLSGHKESMLVSFGGHATFPALIAAKFLGMPIVLHEQNAVMGRTNRWFARYADQVALTFKETHKIPKGVKTKVVGLPIRASIEQVANQIEFLHNEETFNVFVMGGSHGASILSEVVPEALALLKDVKVKVAQQARKEDVAKVKEKYKALGIKAEVSDFFEDVHQKLHWADFVIARAGASSVYEVACTGRSAVFIPLPSAMDDHQYYNAKQLEETELASIIRQDKLTSQILADEIIKRIGIVSNNNTIIANSSRLFPSNSTRKMADLLTSFT